MLLESIYSQAPCISSLCVIKVLYNRTYQPYINLGSNAWGRYIEISAACIEVSRERYEGVALYFTNFYEALKFIKSSLKGLTMTV